MRWIAILFLALLPFNAAAAKMVAQPQDIDSITVLASADMAVPLSEICKLYALKTAQDVNTVYDSAADNVANIEDGDPADIIILPSKKWLVMLDKKGLIEPKSKKIIAKNKLVLASSRFLDIPKNTSVFEGFSNVYNKSLLVNTDANSDGLGEYSLQVLFSLNMWEKFSGRIIPAEDSANALSLIIKGQSAGIIYSSDAKLYADDLNVISQVPAKLHKPIEYYAAVVVDGEITKAKALHKFLTSVEAKRIFQKYGFVVE